MTYGLRVITPPPFEATSLEEAKAFLRVDEDETDQDALISGLIVAARELVEAFTSLSLIEQTLEMTMDAYPYCGYIELPRSPVIAVHSISYIDSSGATTVWDAASYQVDTASLRGRITTAYGYTVPYARGDMNAWRVRFSAGHEVSGSPITEEAARENVPELAKLAMKAYVALAFEGQYKEAENAATSIARPLRTSYL